MSNLLILDFDFFFPEVDPATDSYGLWDWGHKETPFMIEGLWHHRAAGFIRNGQDLPELSGEQVGFWDRFSFTPNARLFAAESNACAANTQLTSLFGYPDAGEPPEQVWLYDAHHDAGYRENLDVYDLLDKGSYTCEDWMVLWSGLGSELFMRYPSWKTYAFDAEPEPAVDLDRQFDAPDNQPEVEFDAVFVCRSGAWVPSWLDDHFFQFLDDAPFDTYTDLLADIYPLKRREFDMSAANVDADQMEQLLETLDAR